MFGPRLLAGLLAITLLSTGARAQQAAENDLRFEAVSIRPATGGGPPISGTTIKGNRLRGTNVTLFGLIRSAYFDGTLVSDQQLIGGPDWIRTERYEIDAVAQGTPTRTEFNRMLRGLLTDRFKLAISRGQRELPVSVLMLAHDDRRLGPKLTRVEVDCAAYRAAFERGEAVSTAFRTDPPQPTQCDTLTVSGPSGTRYAGRAVEMGALARGLVPYVGGLLIDRTGLAGTFDFDVSFTREISSSPAGAPALGDGVGLATALREQLGLRVDRQVAPVDVLIIESAERPAAN